MMMRPKHRQLLAAVNCSARNDNRPHLIQSERFRKIDGIFYKSSVTIEERTTVICCTVED